MVSGLHLLLRQYLPSSAAQHHGINLEMLRSPLRRQQESLRDRLADDLAGVLLVLLQLVFFSCILCDVEAIWVPGQVGAALVVLGFALLAVGLWSLQDWLTLLPAPPRHAAEEAMVRSGAYCVCRHPQYAGLIFACLGLAFLRQSERTLFWTGLLIIVLEKLADKEEAFLCESHPDYVDYRRDTPKFLPWATCLLDLAQPVQLPDCRGLLRRVQCLLRNVWVGLTGLSCQAFFDQVPVVVIAVFFLVLALADAAMPVIWACICWFIWIVGLYMTISSVMDLGVRFTLLTKPPKYYMFERYGVFDWCRHPQYVGMILLGLGTTAYWHHLHPATDCLYWTTLLVLVLQKQVDREDAALLERYACNEEYRAYSRTTPGLIPWLMRPESDLATLRIFRCNVWEALRMEVPRWPGGVRWTCETLRRIRIWGNAEAIQQEQGWGDDQALPWPLGFLNCVSVGSPCKLPSWAYDPRTAEVASSDFFDVQRKTCGPGIRWAWRAVGNSYTLFMVVPFLAYARSSCDAHGGFALCDDLPLFVLFGFSLLIGMIFQVKCVGFVVLAQLRCTAKFQLDLGIVKFPFNKFPFGVWVGIFSLLSSFNLLDTFSNAELVGRVWATRTCPGYEAINQVWSEVMMQAIVSKVLWFTKFDMVNEFAFVYGLILVQLVFALCTCVPIEEGVEYEVLARKVEYKTIYFQRGRADHGSVLQILAETARMEAVIFQDSKCTDRALQQLMIKKPSRWELTSLEKIQAKMARLAVRFFLVAVLQNAFQVNVQLSLLAITKQVTGQIDRQLLFSVVMGMVGMSLDFPDMVEAAKFIYKHVFQSLAVQNFEREEEQQVEAERSLEYVSELRMMQAKVQWTFIRYLMYMFIYLGFLAYSIAKLVGLFVCKSHLLNGDGCAQNITEYEPVNASAAVGVAAQWPPF